MDVISCFFTADYRDGQVYSGGKKSPAGHFTVQLMNQYYVHDTAARIAVFRDGVNGRVLEQLRDGSAMSIDVNHFLEKKITLRYGIAFGGLWSRSP